jgi:hypothetical protein
MLGPDDPHRMKISVTNAIDQHMIEALAPAAARDTAIWLMDNLPDAIRAAGDPDDMEAFIKLAKAQYRVQWDKKADLGSRVHNIAEAINLGAPYIPDEEAAPFVDSYLEFLRDFGVDIRRDIKAAECTVINRTIPYAGTSDIWADLRFPGPTSPIIPKFRPRAVPADPLPTPSGLWLVDIRKRGSLGRKGGSLDFPAILSPLLNFNPLLLRTGSRRNRAPEPPTPTRKTKTRSARRRRTLRRPAAPPGSSPSASECRSTKPRGSPRPSPTKTASAGPCTCTLRASPQRTCAPGGRPHATTKPANRPRPHGPTAPPAGATCTVSPSPASGARPTPRPCPTRDPQVGG